MCGQQGFGCIQASEIIDNKVLKRAYKIHYEPPSIGWFKNPEPDPRYHHPVQKTADAVGFWDRAIKRPTTDRHFTPSSTSSEDIRERFLTCPPAVCSDPSLKVLLESKPLVKSVQGKKELELPGRMFSRNLVKFKETPLFAITQHQSKLAFGNTAAMAQLCGGMQDFLSWLVENWNNFLDITTYMGPSVRGIQPDDPSPHTDTVADQLQAGLVNQSTWLPDMFAHFRDGLQVVANGLRSSLEYNAATMVASSHSGRELVLSHAISTRGDVDWKDQLLQTTYNCQHLFADLPLSSQTSHAWDSKGDIYVSAADIPSPLKKEAYKLPTAKFVPKATSSGGSSGSQGSKRSRPGQPFRHRGRGGKTRPKAQEPKVAPAPPPKPKHPKRGKKGGK